MAPKYGRTTLLINSALRANKSSTKTTDFIYSFPQKVENVVHTNLLSAVIENGVYNVDSTNQNFSVSFNAGTPVNLIIPIGYYDDSTFIQLLSTLLNGASPLLGSGGAPTTFFVEIDNFGILSIINDASSAWSITFANAGTAKLLGFPTLGPYTPLSTAENINGPFNIVGLNKIKLSNYDMLLIGSDRLGNEIASRDNFSAYWSILNGNQLTNSTTITYINYRSPTLEVAWDSPRDIDWVDIRVTDLFGKIIDIGTNNVQLVIELYTDESKRK
jgi:hypothetical protein